MQHLRKVGLTATTLLLVSVPSYGVIQALVPLRSTLSSNQFIFVAKVEKLLPERPGLVLAIAEDLKGKAPFRSLAVNLTGDRESQKDKDTQRLLKRLAPDLPLVLFVHHRGKQFTTFGFTNGTWFQIIGQKTEDRIAWSFTHLEPYLRRTYKGTTAELIKTVRDSLAGKRKPPEPNAKEPPGLGPEIKTGHRDGERGARSVERRALHAPRSTLHTSGPLFAVIPTLGIGGPLAILALLFPSVFGGVLVLFRRWLAFFSVISMISLLYLVRWLWAGQLRQTWLATPGGFSLTLVSLTFLGLFWAGRRHWVALAIGQETEVPGRSEHMVLWSISLTCAGLTLFYFFEPLGAQEWQLLLSLSAGVWVATFYKLLRPLFARGVAAPPLPTEGVMLGITALFFAAYACLRIGPVQTEGRAETAHSATSQFAGKHWDYALKEDGCLVSSPRVAGDRVYVGAAHPSFKGGTLLCLNRATGDELWRFDDEGALKEMFSSPLVADGRLYIGEGFHDDRDCKFFCIDTAKGKKIWEFQTTSQVESSPRLFGGKVFFGAGNDGIYCLDASNGKRIWQLPGSAHKGRLLRVGSTPALAHGNVYAGTGIDRNARDDKGETALLCLDMADGKLIWKQPVDLPCWGGPIVSSKEVFFTLGNGDVYNDGPEPAGAVLCLDAQKGKQLWRQDLPNGVLASPAVDEKRVYVCCRDGNCYCLSRKDGQVLWKTALNSPIISAPVTAASLKTGTTVGVYVAGSRGKICCLDPATGAVQWTYSLEEHTPFIAATPEVEVVGSGTLERRHIYVAATLGDLTEGRPVLYRLDDAMATSD